MAFLRKNWIPLLVNLIVILALYILMSQESSNLFVYLIAFLPVSLLFLAFLFTCYRGFKWQYTLTVLVILLPGVAYTYLTKQSTATEVFLYLFIVFIGQLLGLGMRSVVYFFKKD